MSRRLCRSVVPALVIGVALLGMAGCDGADAGPGCSELELQACQAEPACEMIIGEAACLFGDGLGGLGSLYVGCRDAGDCATVETCAEEIDTGLLLLFPSACLPEGWTALDPADCCPDGVDSCGGLDQLTCEAAGDCVTVMGAPVDDVCADDFDSWMTVYAGCAASGGGAGAAITCGEQQGTGDRLYFPSTALPEGWVGLTDEVCCAATACEALDADGCAADASCAGLLGAPADEICGGDYTNWMSEALGCMSADAGCGDAETCAEEPGGGARMVFPSTCLPDGWTEVAWDECCAGPGCSELHAAACVDSESCAPILGAPAAEICAEDYASWMTVHAGCMDAGVGCGAAETCAQDPATGISLVFPSTCLPDGWTYVAWEDCCVAAPCEALDEAGCAAATDCVPVLGAPPEEVCADDYTHWMSVHSGCMSADLGCGDAETCGQDPATGETLVFPSTCLPGGWTTVAWEDCCVAPPCAELDEAACAAADGCSPLAGAPADEVCADDLSGSMSVHAGCMSSDLGCGGAETCAVQVATGTKLVFPSTCLPAGWEALGEEACCEDAPLTCEELDEAMCANANGCVAVKGAPAAGVCGGDYSEWMSVHAGCMSVGMGCDDVETCAQHPATGARLVFPDSCIPAGWVELPQELCCSTSGCAGLSWADCSADPTCAPTMGAPAFDYCAEDFSTWQSVYAGCMVADQACGEAETCAADPVTGATLVFPTTCVPEGWGAPEGGCCEPSWASLFACDVADDCVVMDMGCCDYCNGGWALAVADGQQEAATAQYGADHCGPVACTKKACSPWFAVCQEGMCALADEPGPVGCAALDGAACLAAAECAPIYGVPAAEACSGGDAAEIMGCMDGNMGCGDFPTCGQDPATGELVQFYDTCIPQGWGTAQSCCADPGGCAVGSEAPIAMLCIRGEAGADGEVLAEGAAASVQITPEGCWSSSCTTIHTAECSVSGGSGHLTAEGLFCLAPTGDDVCTPDCSGGGFASCGTPSLDAGSWTVSHGGLSVTFEVPSVIPYGGACAGSPF